MNGELSLSDLPSVPARGDGSAGWVRMTGNPNAAAGTDPPDRGPDDIGNAARLIAQHGDALRFVPTWNAWLVWDNTRWARDERREHLRRAKETARRIAEEAAAEPDEGRRKQLLQHALTSAREPRLRAMTELAACEPEVVRLPDELDADPWLLNCTNGTVDLRTAAVRDHDPADLLTKTTGTAYDPAARAPSWEAHLERVFGGDGDLISFFQRLAGYSAIGTVSEHVLPILHGAGANGKTTTLNAIRATLGDYAHAAGVDLIVQHRREAGQATPEVAELKGRRLVAVTETKQDGRLAVERVKAITGGDPISARFLHSNPFVFDPTHTAWLITNHRPRVGDRGHAIWRRLLLVPFTVTISDDQKDPNIDAKLAAETTGILTWIVTGAIEYQLRGLAPPESVRMATDDYRRSEDAFGDFLAERIERDPEATVKAGALHTAYRNWADANGARRMSKQSLAEELEASGFRRDVRRDGTYWLGLKVVADDLV